MLRYLPRYLAHRREFISKGGKIAHLSPILYDYAEHYVFQKSMPKISWRRKSSLGGRPKTLPVLAFSLLT